MTDDLPPIDSCEVCGNPSLSPVLDLGAHPMCDDLVAVGEARRCRAYPIEILFCARCNTAHQRFQVPKHALFPTDYHYRSRFTADVLDGMRELVDSVAQRYGDLSGKKVLDIGCNDGSLLDLFRARGARTFGVEPTGAHRDALGKGHTIDHAFLTEALAATLRERHGAPDFITFTNVFAHIENLGQLLASVKTLMAPGTVIVIENHYLGAVLDGKQFDTFYHEHPRTYSYSSFVHMARALGTTLQRVEFPSRYGGNIRVFMGRDPVAAGGALDPDALRAREHGFPGAFAALRQHVATWRTNKRRYIAAQVKAHGPLRAKAFPGRAAILVRLLDLDHEQISAVYEKPGSLKIGHYLPGTRIPILSDEALPAATPESAPLLNLAWHISAEIRHYLAAAGYHGPVVDILDADDFKAA